MGNRAQVRIVDTGVYLYTHWDGKRIKEIVKSAMQRKERWDDPGYLARIIFSEMIKNDVEGNTGYGIGTEEHFDLDYGVIIINCQQQLINCLEFEYSGTRRELVEHPMGFEEFIKE